MNGRDCGSGLRNASSLAPVVGEVEPVSIKGTGVRVFLQVVALVRVNGFASNAALGLAHNGSNVATVL